ncbi:hypothetical protein KSC_004130 [Ktedonobacter sp. SOSP1-52]|uniref:hypothetical protein n=1 Tax=Ktedonobacter sp. SOSP1-52 TaxID=2778366 RepID=UPI001914EBB3|nr:hypothetical protein [Ktedonobacter sp. SOSP1-52]GHO61521.1 hypothetical protein KSC_004130 [Ktedonobacter sp. SOSP1-52]
MKNMWCWRCQQEVLMLDEEEYNTIYTLYGECFLRASKERKELSRHEHLPLPDYFLPVSKEYERMTGMKDIHPNVVLHHRIATYGAPCPRCSKPLRTPIARFCAACGEVVN